MLVHNLSSDLDCAYSDSTLSRSCAEHLYGSAATTTRPDPNCVHLYHFLYGEKAEIRIYPDQIEQTTKEGIQAHAGSNA